MVYERKPKHKPLTFSTGGAVPTIDPPPAPPPISVPETGEALQLALKAQLEAEEIARAPAPQPVIDDYVERIPGLSDHKKAFLRANPWALQPDKVEIMRRVHKSALADGIEDDTPEMDSRLIRGVHQELAQLIERFTPRTEPETSEPPKGELPTMARPPAAQPAPPMRRSVPVSAPVVREVPSVTGKPQSYSGKITLTAEERDIARRSFGSVSGVNLSNAQKEELYAMNKARYLQMLANGSYSRQDG